MIFSHPTLKACNSPYMQYYFKRFFVLHSSEVIFSFLIKTSRQKAIEIEIAFFDPPGLIPLEIPRVARTLDHFFYASHIRHNFPLQTDTYISELVEVFLKLSTKTVWVHLIIWTNLVVPVSCKLYKYPTVVSVRKWHSFRLNIFF